MVEKNRDPRKSSVQSEITTAAGQKRIFGSMQFGHISKKLNKRRIVIYEDAKFFGGFTARGLKGKLRDKYEADRKAAGHDNSKSSTLEKRREFAKEWSEKNIPLAATAIRLRRKIATLPGHSLNLSHDHDVTIDDMKGGISSEEDGIKTAKAIAYKVKKTYKAPLIKMTDKTAGLDSHATTITSKEQKEEEKRVQDNLRNFREQGYLVAKMQDLAAHNVVTGYEYKNYAYLRHQPLTGPLTSQLQGIGQRKLAPLLGLDNKQLSALTPMFRLFKIDSKNRKKGPEELKLQGNYHSIENKSLESIGRSGRLGLKSFTWTYDGKYLSTANKMILGDLTLYGDSLTVFDEKIVDDLLVPQSGDWYALVGWAPPSNNAGGLFSQEEISALKNSLLTLWMSFKIPQFSFNQDGTFELNLTFRSAIMQALNNVDIFGPTNAKEELLDVSAAFTSKVQGIFKKHLKRRHNSLAVRGRQSAAVGAVGRGDSAAKIKAIDAKMLTVFKSETLLKNGIQPKDLAKAQKLVDNFMKNEKVGGDLDYAYIFSERMTALLEKKRSNKVFRRILEDIEKKKRKFYVTLTADEYDKFYKAFGALLDTSTITQEEYKATQKKNPPPSNAPKKPTGVSLVDKKTEVKTTVADLKPDEISVAFVYFGDIIESLLSTTKYQAPDREKINFILSTLAYRDYFAGGPNLFKSILTQVPIVDVPISVNYFTKWFHDEYIVKVSDKVTLDEFLNKALKTLLLPAMGPDNFRASFKNHSMAPHQFSWTADKKANQPPRGLIKFETLKNLIYQGSMTTNPISYIVYSSWVYAEDEKAKSSKGSIHSSTVDDPVLHLAKDRGLLKDVSFSRLNEPHWEADKIRNDKITSNFDKVRIPYNVEVKMIGNNLFFPGTRFEVYPTIPGSRSRDIANQLGLGGRYLAGSITNRIESESGFTTEFTGINERIAGSEKKGKKKSAKKTTKRTTKLGK
jgi:hypothetical protein